MMEKQYTDITKSVTRIGSNLIAALPDEWTDDCIGDIGQALVQSAYDSDVTGAVLNFARVSMMDSCSYQAMLQLSKAITLMGIRVVWTGLSPGVVCALADLGVPLQDKAIVTVASLDQALGFLAQPSVK